MLTACVNTVDRRPKERVLEVATGSEVSNARHRWIDPRTPQSLACPVLQGRPPADRVRLPRHVVHRHNVPLRDRGRRGGSARTHRARGRHAKPCAPTTRRPDRTCTPPTGNPGRQPPPRHPIKYQTWEDSTGAPASSRGRDNGIAEVHDGVAGRLIHSRLTRRTTNTVAESA